MEKTKHAQQIRLAVQIFFFTMIAFLTGGKALAEAGILPAAVSEVSLHAICPFGGVVTLYNLATVGRYIQKIHASSVVLMVLVFLSAILFGPVLCGWVCPLGSLQEWVGGLGRKLFGKRYNNLVPAKADRILRFARYGVLIWVVYVTAASTKLVFQDVDPYFALFNFYSGEVALTALLILAVTVLLSLLMERPWCKYACPYGAVLGLTNLFRVFGIRRKSSTCIDCKACDRACPMNIIVSTAKTVTDHQCISCLKCTSDTACVVPDTVAMATPSFKMGSKEKTL